MILVIDNYDSFTWNLVQAIGSLRPGLVLGRDLIVARNDQITAPEAERLAPDHLIVSPGPCGPAEAGASGAIIERLAGRAAVLGVCLGHQCIGALYGMAVERGRAVHGKTSLVHHDGAGVFEGMPSPLRVARYHSLHIPRRSVPDGWVVSAWTDDGEVMGLRRDWDRAPLEGVQFHPESFMTEHGPRLLANFLAGTPSLYA